MATLKVEKVTGTPSFLKPNTLYLCSSASDPVDLTLICTDSAGNSSKSTVNRHDLSQAVATLLKRSDQAPKTSGMTQQVGVDPNGVLWVPPSASSGRIVNAYLPNYGDTVDIKLGAEIVISMSCIDTNSPGQFLFRMKTTTVTRSVAWSRTMSRQQYSSMIYSNSTTLNPSSSFMIDTTIGAEMTTYNRFTIVDLSSLESWGVEFFFFSNGRFKARVSDF